jgi:xanthine dehydrogenase YagS FAD-binding subunit
MMSSFALVRAATVEEALAELGPGVALHAGGVDLLDRMKEGLDAPTRLVSLRGVRALDGIRDDGGALVLGALTTLSAIADSAAVRDRWDALASACAHAATPQIRNMATIGGNLMQRPRCWYFRSADFHCRKKGGSICFAHDGESQLHAILGNSVCAAVHPSSVATALVAYGATLTLQSKKGTRELALERFFTLPDADPTRENVLAPDELVTAVKLPAPAAGTHAAYAKQTEKESFDWPLADVAVVLQLRGGSVAKASVVLGAAAPVPWRARTAEEILGGRIVDEHIAESAAGAALQGAAPLRKNGYKLPLFRAVVRRTILAAAGGAA